jgi:hypothetical protein
MTGDRAGVDRAITKLHAGRIGLSTPDDIPAALMYAAEFLTARNAPHDCDLAQALSDEAVRWLQHRDEPMIRLQTFRSDLQRRAYRNTGDPADLYRATTMLADAVDRMAASEETDGHAEHLVELLLEHFRATGRAESLDRAERVCRNHPAVGGRYLSQVRTARTQSP